MQPEQVISAEQQYARKIMFFLGVILFFKIAGYFTLTENVALTRVLKVAIRMSMTGWVLIILYGLKKRGNPTRLIGSNVYPPLLYGVYLTLGLVSLGWSTNPGYSLLQLTMTVESFYFTYLFLKAYYVLTTYYDLENDRISSLFSPAIFFIILSFVIGLFISPDTFYRLTHGGEEARLGGYLMNPNELGMLAVVGMSSAVMELLYGRHKVRTVIMLLVMLYALILTGSRSSMIGFLLIVFFFVNRSDNKRIKALIMVGAVASIPVIVSTIFIKQGDLEEVLSMTGRLPFWKALLTEGLPKEPLLGFGFMRIAYTEAFQSVHTYAGKMTHNTFIQVLMNLGFIGFFTVVLQMAATFMGARKADNRMNKVFFVGMLIPIMINSFTEFGIFGEANYGILFYQFLIFLFCIKPAQNLSKVETIRLRANRPHFSI